jgi:hypothetical protein
MFRDRPGQHNEPGAFYDLKNVIVTPSGLLRRPGFDETVDSEFFEFSAEDGRMVGAVALWAYTGQQRTFIITDQLIYSFDLSGFDLSDDSFPFGPSDMASSDGIVFTSASANILPSQTNGIEPAAPGDMVLVADVSGASPVILGSSKIASVDSATQFTLESAIPGFPFSSPSPHIAVIYRGLRTRPLKRLPDWTTAYGALYIVSEGTFLLESDLAGPSPRFLPLTSGDALVAGEPMAAGAIGFFNERVWYGNVREYDTVEGEYIQFRQRLRYSVAGNPKNIADTAFIDLDYTPGAIQRILPLGNLLAVYLEDAIYLGRPNNIQGLPLTFDRVQTGSVGLVGQRAIISFQDGHFFVGPDNIYYHSTRGLEPIGTPVLEQTIRQCQHPWRIIATIDTRNNRVLFGFPEANEFITRVWSFNYLTNGWSYEEYGAGNTWSIDNTYLDLTVTIDSLTTGTINTMPTNYGPTIDSLGGGQIFSDALIRERGNRIDISDRSLSEDVDQQIESRITSIDHDLDAPDMQKRWSRLAVKLEFRNDIPFTAPLDFNVEISHNRGVTWKNVGTMRIKAGMDEGHVDFRSVGPHLRFRISSSASVPVYWLSEYTLYWSPSGPEGDLGTQE